MYTNISKSAGGKIKRFILAEEGRARSPRREYGDTRIPQPIGGNIVFAVLTEDLTYGGTADALVYTTVSPLGGVSTGETLEDCWCPILLVGKKFSSGFHVLIDRSKKMVINSMECPVDAA